MRRVLAGLGRGFVTLGLLVMLFVAYELWGTGIFTARAQARLKREEAAALSHARATHPKAKSAKPKAIDPALFAPPEEGHWVSRPATIFVSRRGREPSLTGCTNS